MKKSILLILFLILFLGACTTQTENSTNASDGEVKDTFADVSLASNTPAEDLYSTNIYIKYQETQRNLHIKYKDFVETVLNSENWIDGTVECICDYTIQVDNVIFEYSSHCGTLNYNRKSKQLSDTQQTALNAILLETFGMTNDN